MVEKSGFTISADGQRYVGGCAVHGYCLVIIAR
jgi:hypothetical protein